MADKIAKKVSLKVPIKFFYGTGRRKEAVAKVWLFDGKGEFVVNNLTALDYFNDKLIVESCEKPLQLLGLTKTIAIKVTVLGGGKAGQANACTLGISRALISLNSEFRKKLKENGLLTRDPRVKERKKYGLRGARKAPQFRKR